MTNTIKHMISPGSIPIILGTEALAQYIMTVGNSGESELPGANWQYDHFLPPPMGGWMK
ncbi:MAG: hypothetical protein GX250_02825 [Clostridiales bacterium]|jgi:hypothetical protein|nr:hypothetical protein [Clostridiales bacterium]